MVTRRRLLKNFTKISAGGLFLNHSLDRYAFGQILDQFQSELSIPPPDAGSASNGRRNFYLRLQRGSTQFLPNAATSTFGINGDYLGPTLRFRRGEEVSLNVENRLGESSSLHWHGFHLPPTEDGGPHQSIAEGQSWNARFEVIQLAGTYWYHSHVLHQSGRQVYKGLAGMILVDDESAPMLPQEYGVDDIPLIIQDRRFDESGGLQYRTLYQDDVMGMMGDTILVNGTYRPYFRPSTSLVRFRVLNASNARSYNLAFSDNRSFYQIATDGGLLAAPVALTSLVLAPAERAEILVAFDPSDAVTLMSIGQQPAFPEFPGGISQMMRSLNTETFQLLALRASSSLTDNAEIPAALSTVFRLPEAAATNTRRFTLQMGAGMRSGEDRGPGTGARNGTGGGYGGGNYFINGRVMDMDFINERIQLNTTEIWEVRNNSPMMHPFHIHNGQFQVLDRNGRAPQANELGWKDTVQVRSGELVRLIMRFTDYIDESNPYMYHCHILEHEDRGMMGQFVLV